MGMDFNAFSTNTTSWHDDFPEIVRRLCLLGLSDPQIADNLGITYKCLVDWREERQEFRRAFFAGRNGADSLVAGALFQRALGYSHEETRVFYNAKLDTIVEHKVTKRYAPDTSAAMFWLANRAPALWKYKVAEGADGEQLRTIAATLMAEFKKRAGLGPLDGASATDAETVDVTPAQIAAPSEDPLQTMPSFVESIRDPDLVELVDVTDTLAASAAAKDQKENAPE